MILLVIAYIVIAWIEWVYLKSNTKKPRTKWVVFGFIAFSFFYNVFVLYVKDLLPTPHALLIRFFGPIQKSITGG
ncbi:hypothetical protein GC098_23040 [Paenibacillus sp. LMG 31458]|uniref:Uncharacterized protein n=1 Tax=Paenibacillus phytorum TaxID=2654977 RepID=A0ABX1Y080_9BACL|nr:hypothetical protein [Paenibacillus phytorum]NOU74237.1 hypothetical protein [Paenibacillus phytorum]